MPGGGRLVNSDGCNMIMQSYESINLRYPDVYFLIVSVIFPEFDSIMAFKGGALCFTICVT